MAFAQEICREISLKAIRYNCWKEIALNNLHEMGWEKALMQYSKLENEESRFYYMRGLVEKVELADCTKERIFKINQYFAKDITLFEQMMQKHILKRLFFEDTSSIPIQKFNSILNLQWAIDLKKELDQIPN